MTLLLLLFFGVLSDPLSEAEEIEPPNAFSFPAWVWLNSERDSLSKLDTESESPLLALSCSFFKSVARRSSFFSVSVTYLCSCIPRCFLELTFYLCFMTWKTTIKTVSIAIRPRTDPITIAIIEASVRPSSSTSSTGIGSSTHSSSPSSQVVVSGFSRDGSIARLCKSLEGSGVANVVYATNRIPFRYSNLVSI